MDSGLRNFAMTMALSIFMLSAYGLNSKERIVWLDEMDLTKVDQAAGIARANQSMWRTPLVIATDTFDRGVGTHAEGIIRISLDGNATCFKALVGVDQSAPVNELAQASVEFLVIGDGKILFRSGIMRSHDKAKDVKVNLQGIHSLILRVTHANDGIVGDRADWVNANISYKKNIPYIVDKPREFAERKTPQISDLPQINPPYIYGSYVNCPFLFTLPVSGEEPMKFRATKLPEGLVLDSITGIITGTPTRKGIYSVSFHVENSLGSDDKELEIHIGDTLLLTPPMGWNSWNVFGANISDSIVRKTADQIVSSGLIHFGYSYINIDDGWQGTRGGRYNAIQPNDKFPDMKALVDYVHSKGLKIGIYSSPWVQTFAGYVGGSADTSDGQVFNPSRRCGNYSFAENDVKQWAEWGFDFLKYDWVTNDVQNTSQMSQLLKSSGRNFGFSISNAAPFELASVWKNNTNAWRTTGDIKDTWCSMTTIGFLQNKWQPYGGRGHWNDPDMLVVGKLGWGDTIRDSRLTPNEQYTHISLWSLLAAPLLIGCDLNQLDDFTLGLLTNREVIAINQDKAGIQGRCIIRNEQQQYQIWARPLSDGSVAVGIFNLDENDKEIALDCKALNLNGRQKVRDIWQQKDVGVITRKYTVTVPSHGVNLITLKKEE